jgi:hypothetical protein
MTDGTERKIGLLQFAGFAFDVTDLVQPESQKLKHVFTRELTVSTPGYRSK